MLSVWSWTAFGQDGGDQQAVEQSTAPTAMTTPAMTGTLAANPNPLGFDAGPLGPVYLTGAISGLGLWQNNKFLSNGQVFLQKTEGLFQYYLDVGAYTIPTLGARISVRRQRWVIFMGRSRWHGRKSHRPTVYTFRVASCPR